MRKKRTIGKTKSGAPCKSSYEKVREGGQVYRRRYTGGKIKIEKRGEKEIRKETNGEVEDTREREGHPIDIRYRSGCIAFSCGRPDYTSIHTHTHTYIYTRRMVLFVVTEIIGCGPEGPRRRCNIPPRGRGTADRYRRQSGSDERHEKSLLVSRSCSRWKSPVELDSASENQRSDEGVDGMSACWW